LRPCEAWDETDISGEIVQAAEKILKKKPAGIAMTGMDTKSVRDCIDRIAQKGIPVVTFNSDLPGTKRSCFVGQDLYRSGRVAANMLLPGLRKEDRILAVAGNLDYAAHNSRIQGFLDACAEGGFSSDQIVIKESHNEYFLTYEIVRRALAEMPDFPLQENSFTNITVVNAESIRPLDTA